MVVYGDEGYGQSAEVKAPFPECQQRELVTALSYNDWGFGFISNNFDYLVATKLYNLLRCNSMTTSFFDMEAFAPDT
ncbi:hypothetical protein DFQ26_004419 [Actinomortierella ambigua]|nr:hypothetical protein DFQ26_004419 [Actinomortierella ambigua]